MRFEIPGRPIPAVRMTGRGKYVKKNAQRYLGYKELIGYITASKFKAPMTGHVDIRVIVYLYGKTSIMGMDGDVDNYLKSAMDGLAGIAYLNDRQVIDGSAKKRPVKHKKDERMVIEIQESEML